MRSLIWFRRDLRVFDNSALSQATNDATRGVIGLFVITPKQWKQHDDADCKVSFWLNNLRHLSCSLAKLRIPLLIATCDTFDEVPPIVVSVARKHDCSILCFNREYEVNESRRDKHVTAACEQAGLVVRQFHDRVIVPPQEISTKDGKYCLELADVPSRALHDATRLAAAIDTSIDYPKFIVDHKFARERALAEFKAVG